MSGNNVVMKTFSPIHIGTGQTYGSTEILQQGSGYIRVRDREMVQFLCDQKREDEFFREMASDSVRLDKYIRGKIPEQLFRYSLLSHDTSTRFPLRDVRECMKTMDVPYIPGSSLKGAIRSAILWKTVRDDPSFVTSLQLNKDKNKKTVGNDYFSNLFSTGNPRDKPDAKFDLLKFVEVSDFVPLSGQKDLLSLAGIITYSRQRQGNLTKKQYITLAECIPSMIELTGSIRISPQLSAALNDREHYPLLEEKLKMLGLSDDPDDETRMISHLKSVCSEFTRFALERELLLCEQNSDLSKSPNVCKSVLDKKHRNLVRLGFGVGTGYQTMIHELIEQDLDSAAKLINEMRLGKYDRQYDDDDGRLDPPYPKSVEFTTMNKPLGWIVW